MGLRRRLRDTTDYVRALADVGMAVFTRPITNDDPDFLEYGWVELAPETMQAIFNGHVRLDERGFTEVRRGFFAREANADVIDVLSHGRAKTKTHIRWGVSLAFVPHDWRYRGRFHRTLKSAREDLFDQDWGGPGITYVYGVPRFTRDLELAWEYAAPRAARFWDASSSLAGVLSLAEEQISRPAGEYGFTIDGFFVPGPRFVRAFTLARMGRVDDARDALEDWKARHPNDVLGVDEAFARIAAAT